jgi:hypothetical protein
MLTSLFLFYFSTDSQTVNMKSKQLLCTYYIRDNSHFYESCTSHDGTYAGEEELQQHVPVQFLLWKAYGKCKFCLTGKLNQHCCSLAVIIHTFLSSYLPTELPQQIFCNGSVSSSSVLSQIYVQLYTTKNYA